MINLITNYNWNSKLINAILRLEFAYSSGTETIIEEYKQNLKEWSKLNDNVFSDSIFFDLDNNDKEKFNLTFWTLNIILFNERELWNEYLDVIVKLILILENEYSIEDKKKYLYMIMNFKKNILFEIKNGALIFDKSNNDLNYQDWNIDDARGLIDFFIRKNEKINLYPSTVKRNYDYTICPQNLYSILEILYYYCTINEEFMTEEIILNLDNFFNKRFYFIILSNKFHFSETKKNVYINKFKKEEWIYEDEFLFIILSKMNNTEFEEFLDLEINSRYKDSDFLLKANIFWKYYDIYKYYQKNYNLEINNSTLTDLFNYRNLALKRPKTAEELDHYLWFNETGIAYNSFSSNKSIYDIQEQKALIINNYNKYEKIIYLAEQIDGLINGKGFYYLEIDGIIKKINPKVEEIIDVLNNPNEIQKINESVKNFNYNDDFKKNLSTNLVLLKSYLIDFINVSKINEELSKFCKKHHENSLINNLKLSVDSCNNFLSELNECFKLKFNSENSKYENIFLLCKIDDEFLSILYSFSFGNKHLKSQEIFLSYLEIIIEKALKLERNEESELIKKSLNFQLKLNKYILFTKKPFSFKNNIFVIKYNIFFQKDKNFMKEYFEKNICKKDKKFYLLILLKTVFFEGYRSHLEAVKHLNFIMETKYIIDILMENFAEDQSILDDEKWRKRESKETSIFYADDIEKNYIVLWSLFSICCFSNDFEKNKFDAFKEIYSNYFKEKIDYKSLRIYRLIGNIYININYQISLNEITQENMYVLGEIILWFLKGLIDSNRFSSLVNYEISDYEYEEYLKYLNNEFIYNWSNFNKDEIEIKLLIFNALIIFTELNKYDSKEVNLSSSDLKEKEIIQKVFKFSIDNLENEDMWVFKNISIFKNHFTQIEKNLDILNQEILT